MRDHDGFTTLLGKHFRHNNYKSWVRQLNSTASQDALRRSGGEALVTG